jgi:molybdopterin synthase sulfur carrier subunit
MITVTFFGPLKELSPDGALRLPWPGGTTDDLLRALRARGPAWDEALAPERVFRVAVNRQLLQGGGAIQDGDEVGIVPPVTGG